MAVGAFLHSALVKAGEVVVVVGEVAETILVVFFLFACVLLLDYLKEAEKNLLRHGPGSGDQASIGLVQ